MARDGAVIDGWYYPLEDLIEDDDGHIVLRPGVIPMGERNATAAPAKPKHVVVPEDGALVDGWYYPAHDLMVKAGKVAVRPGVAVRGLVEEASFNLRAIIDADLITAVEAGAPTMVGVTSAPVLDSGGNPLYLSDCSEPTAEGEASSQSEEDDVAKPAPGPHKQAGDKMTRADKGDAGGARGNGGSKPPATGTTYSTKG